VPRDDRDTREGSGRHDTATFGGERPKSQSGGAKLSRSETVTVRLDPKLRYLAALAARKHRRTLSSFIEWAIEENLKHVHLDDKDGSPSLADQAGHLWDVDEPDRFAKLALHYPHMLTHDEQVMWKLVREIGFFWRHQSDGSWYVDEETLNSERLRQYWATLNAVSRGDANRGDLPDDSFGPTR
jgi:hypothetical protein